MAAPMIPALNDMELEKILEAGRAAGASSAGYVLLRLPHELKGLFREWLENHYPDRARHVLGLVAETHGGKLYDSAWGARQRGSGPYAELLRLRFDRAVRRLGYAAGRMTPKLDTSLFRRPPQKGDQLALF
jgi:DNA repair photolyase